MIKLFSKTILKYYLKYITKIVLAIHHPKIIAVTGSTNKAFVCANIRNILNEKGKTVRTNPKNFNTEIGLPLAILNLRSGYNSYRNWLPIIFEAVGAIFKKDFPEFLVLELGVSCRGDMRYLLSIVHPEICIITDITQRYIESFSGLDQLVGEYAFLVESMDKHGQVILNYDNSKIRGLAKKTKAKIIYFGKTISSSDGFRIENVVRTEKGDEVEMKHGDSGQKFNLRRFGEHHAYAAAVGMIIQVEVD